MSYMHITENSLRRIANGMPNTGNSVPYRWRACEAGSQIDDRSVIVNPEAAGGPRPLSNIGKVTCPVCRVLIDGALERVDVSRLMEQVAP